MEIEKNELLKRYKDTLMRSIPLNIPTIQKDELSRAIDYSIQKRFKDAEAIIVNNYKIKACCDEPNPTIPLPRG